MEMSRIWLWPCEKERHLFRSFPWWRRKEKRSWDMFCLHGPGQGKSLCWRSPRWLFRPKGSGRGLAVRLSGKGTALPGSWAMAMPPCWEARNTMPDLAMLPPAGMAFRLPREFLRRILWRFAYERMRAPWRELSSMPRNLEYNGKENAQVGKNLCFF